MRQPRLKVNPEEEEAVYHCMSRTVNGDRLFGDVEKDMFRRQLRQLADFAGLEIYTHTMLDNHFHLLVRVPRWEPVSDQELLRRYAVLYPKPTKYQPASLEAIKAQLGINSPEGIRWRQRLRRLMGDISPFMKLLKQRYTRWFNDTHDRFGTLWAERYKSVLVESSAQVIRKFAAYIDLNCVRAGIVSDPKDYRFCGYAEAVAGHLEARRSILALEGTENWEEAQAGYRQYLFALGSGPREQGGGISEEEFRKVLAEGGRLSLAAVLRCRIRYFSDGAVLGSRAFVQAQLTRYQERFGRRKGKSPVELPAITDWGDLTSLRRLRQAAFG